MRKILLTGGSGLLGSQLQRHLECDAPCHDKFDITNPKFKGDYYAVIHAAAYTNVDKAEEDVEKLFEVNLGGTLKLLYEYSLLPFVYISSEYAHNPVNMYSASKLAGELAVKTLAEHYLIIRTLFKSNPWNLNVAWMDQWTNGDYVDVIAPLIACEIKKWLNNEFRDSKTIYVGTGRKTMYDLAVRTRKKVKPVSLKKWRGVKRPYDYQ